MGSSRPGTSEFSGYSVYGVERKENNVLRFKEDSSRKDSTRLSWKESFESSLNSSTIRNPSNRNRRQLPI